MTFRDEWAAPAARSYKAILDAKLKLRIDGAVAQIRADPFNCPDVIPLKGALAGLWRKRIGDWRLIFSIDPQAKIVHVRALLMRKDAY